MSREHGFAVVELMVTIALVSILSTIATVQLNFVLAKSRNNMRKATLVVLREALEQYYFDHGRYPTIPTTDPLAGLVYFSSEPNDGVLNGPNDGVQMADLGINPPIAGNWIPKLVPTYISKLPRDPLGGNSTYPPCAIYGGGGIMKRAYWYATDHEGTTYKLMAHCSIEGMEHWVSDPIGIVTAWLQEPFRDPARVNDMSCLMVCTGEPACSSY